MDKCNFAQYKVLGGHQGLLKQRRAWNKFTKAVKRLGYTVRVTGGAFLTHEINCSEDDLNIIIGLAKDL